MSRRERAVELARRLEAWGDRRGWSGTDPYDGLNARRRLVGPLKSRPLGRRLLIQAVKRSPADLRPALGIRPAVSAASAAWVSSAYANGGFLEPRAGEDRLRRALALLERLRSPRFDEPCWGYHFDFQSRVFFYARGEPNSIATAFAGHALIDAYRSLGDDGLLDEARAVGRFLLGHVPLTPTEDGSYFGYLPGDRSPIHNSSLLVGSFLARLVAEGGDEHLSDAASAALRYTVARQRPDGAWPYGERDDLRWVDGFHTGYLLDALRAYADADVDRPLAEAAWRRGLEFYADRMFLADGTPKYFPESLFPIDAQCVAQGIQTLSIAALHDPAYREPAWRVFGFAVRRMLREDGMPLFQRRRWWSNGAQHPRWVVAPTLLALSHLLAVPEGASTGGLEARTPELTGIAAG